MSSKSKKAGKGAENLYDIVEVIVQALAIIFILFTFFFRVSGVVGDSMNPTLTEGDWLLLTNYTYNPRQGDIVVITQQTAADEPLIKRVIATEGQVVDIDFDEGTVKVDGKVLDEPYVAAPTYRSYNLKFPHKVKAGCVFCMGDNRNESWDSRDSAIGDIDVRNIIGEAKFRIFPFGQFKINNNGGADA